MKTLFRKIALLCILSMVLSTVAIGFAAEGDKTESASVTVPLSGVEYNTLNGLGMLSDFTQYIDGANITRADFGYIIARLAGFSEGYTPSRSFVDIPETAYYADAIGFLADSGIVNGAGSGYFNPTDYITYDQAAKMAIRVLGYSVVAQEKYGDYPEGDRLMALELDIITSAMTGDIAMTTNNAFIMLDNIIRTAMAVPASYGTDEVELKYNEDETILAVNHGIYFGEGLMTDNGTTAIDGLSSITAGGAVIGENRLRKTKEGFDTTELIGQYVEYWYHKDNSMLIYANTLAEDDDVLTINYSELDTTNSDFTATNVVYLTESGKEKNAKIAINANMIYNGGAYPYFTVSDLKIKSGYMTLTDVNYDGAYDIIRVVEYEDCTAMYVNFANNTIQADSMVLDLDDYETVSFEKADGTVIKMTDLANGSPVSVIRTKDNTSIKIIDCSALKFSGTVTVIGESDDGRKVYTINEQKYMVSNGLVANINSGIQGAQYAQVGGNYTFYLGMSGEIFKLIDGADETWTVGYCVAIAESGSSFAPKLMIKTIMKDGNVWELEFADKFILNDEKNVDAEKVLDSDLFFDKATGKVIRQPLMFKVNEWGEASGIRTAVDNTGSDFSMDLENFSKDYYGSSVAYKADNVKAIQGGYFVGAGTTIFVDPYVDDPDAAGQSKKVKVLDQNGLAGVQGLTKCALYDIDSSLNVGVVVVKEIGGGGTSDEMWAQGLFLVKDLITSASTEEGEEGEMVYGIQGTINGSSVEYQVKDEDVIEKVEGLNLARGCVCRIRLQNTEILDIELIEDLRKEPICYTSRDYIDTNFGLVYAPIYGKSDGGVITFMPDDDPNGIKILGHSFNGRTAISIYDRSRDEVSTGTIADLYTNIVPKNDGSATVTDETPWIFIHRRYAYTRDMIMVIE